MSFFLVRQERAGGFDLWQRPCFSERRIGRVDGLLELKSKCKFDVGAGVMTSVVAVVVAVMVVAVVVEMMMMMMKQES